MALSLSEGISYLRRNETAVWQFVVRKVQHRSKRSIFRGCYIDSKVRNTAFEIYSTTESILGFSFGFKCVFKNVEILRAMENHTYLEYDPPS